MTYAEGDEVDVWDGDLRAWVPGVVDSIAPGSPLGDVWMVKTQTSFEGLPLTYGVPTTRGDAIRPRRSAR